MPLAVSTTTRRGLRAVVSTKERTWATYSASRSRRVRRPGAGAGAGSGSARTMASIWPSPVSAPTGAAPARHILMPLNSAGLCEAVNTAPGRSRRPEAKYITSVEHSPMSTTSTPWASTPSTKAAASPAPWGRMSRPTTTDSAPLDRANRAKAPPMARQAPASI